MSGLHHTYPATASEQDQTIARVSLAGWQIVRLGGRLEYALYTPEGRLYAYHSTRYTAALAAELAIWNDHKPDVSDALPDAAKAFGGPLPPR